MCSGCPKKYVNADDGSEHCWFDSTKCNFWNDLLSGFECDYYEHYKREQEKKRINKVAYDGVEQGNDQ